MFLSCRARSLTLMYLLKQHVFVLQSLDLLHCSNMRLLHTCNYDCKFYTNMGPDTMFLCLAKFMIYTKHYRKDKLSEISFFSIYSCMLKAVILFNFHLNSTGQTFRLDFRRYVLKGMQTLYAFLSPIEFE